MKNRNSTYIIAEAGVNHNGSLGLAKRLIDEAKKAGADAVKFQTFHAEDLVTEATPKAAYQLRDRKSGMMQLAMLKRLELSGRDHKMLYRYAQKRKIEFLSTPFDIQSLDFLVKLGIKKIKISSGDLTNGPLLLAAARTRLPVVLSTGMSTIKEIEDAFAVLAFGYSRPRAEMPTLAKARGLLQGRESKALLFRNVSLLHCTTEYPAPFSEVNLRAMDAMRERFCCRIGFSDHSEGIVASIAAVGRGAVVIEKHLTLGRNMPGPDHRASLEPAEFAALVRGIRAVEAMLGSGEKEPTKSEMKNIPVARKSLVAARPILRGEFFTDKNLASRRAGKGLSPMRFWDMLGKRAKQNYKTDQKVRL
ncbi:MAG: N-acetylneuraminate synthase [Omnitrophica bacterium RIFOXYB12_FULL_50_7]|nr:MAG: N-acetylneuraminate synthase [Omnitrophica bacterium RIFOXYB12_FULL_50_7]